jgi:uncharacterized protein
MKVRMDQVIVSEVMARLAAVASHHHVAIPLAIESGSRAWGFPSPDSDYDCRFIYVPRIDDALGLFARRDVIETPLTPVLDVNGWELRKAIKLMLKGNAVVLEWLRSPIVYQKDQLFTKAMLELSAEVFQRGAVVRHYRSILRSKQKEHFGDPSQVPLKKVLYAIRSALALRYLRLNRDVMSLPMNIDELSSGADLPQQLRDDLTALLAAKSVASELGMGPLSSSFEILMNTEAEAAEEIIAADQGPQDSSVRLAEARYLELLKNFAPE